MKFWFGKKREDTAESDSAQAVQETFAAPAAFSTTPCVEKTEVRPTPPPQHPVEVPTPPDPRPVIPPQPVPEKLTAPAAPIVKLKAIGTPLTIEQSELSSNVAQTDVTLPSSQPSVTTPTSYGFKARESLQSEPTPDPVVPTQDELKAILRPKNNAKTIYDQFLNGLYDLVILVDRHGHIVECNRRAETMLGYANRTDTWDMPISKIINGMTPPLFEQLKQSLATNDYAMINSRCICKDGATFPCEIGVSKTSFSGNNIVFSIRNSERHQAQELEARQQKQALEFSLAPTFICTPQDGAFISVNQSFLDAFGIPTRQAALDITFFDLMPNLRELFGKAIAGVKVHEKMEIAAAAGQNIKIEIVLAPAFASNKTIHAVIGSLMQI